MDTTADMSLCPNPSPKQTWDTRFFGTPDTDSDTGMNRVMTSDMGMSENLGHGHTSDTLVRSSLTVTFKILFF